MVVLSEFVEGSSSSSTNHKYDVFLSFRGVDTRLTFTDHLHKDLLDANLSTFLDDEEIETGGDLKPELESALKASRASIIVLSENYANSSWCLNELVLILEQRMASKQIVIPIFYHVDPTDVRKQQSSFGDAMAEHKQKMEAETNAKRRSQLAQKIDRWIKALTEVADLKGKNANGRRETEFIQEIVEGIYRSLHIPLRSALPLLFGMNDSIDYVTSWLKNTSSNTGDILTILGMGGIGKTSLARYVYGLHFREFDTSSYIENISKRCACKFNGLLDLQEQLHGDISKRPSIQVHDASIYTSKIVNTIACKKVFIVLDDVDSLDQLDALLGSKGLHPGSKIIITTKDACLIESYALFKSNVKPTHSKHLLQGLYEMEARRLLCFHAFMCNDPKAGYECLVEKVVKYCKGHPLALKVLGKSLCTRDVAYWEECIEGLKEETLSCINKALQISFDSLPSKNDKELFKHIACFFVGVDRDYTETILKACGIKTRSGIINLVDRCLLSIGWNNKLMMHDLLQDMGRFVVHEESPDKPWKRSRLWCNEESFKVLKQKKGRGNLLGLSLDMRMLEKEKLCAISELKTDALSNMDNLMLLRLDYMRIKGSYKNFPEELRWLCMHGFPLKFIPFDLPMKNLVALDLSNSKIESFGICYSSPQGLGSMQEYTVLCLKDKGFLGSLKILNLSFCEQLRSLGGFVELPALENLIVRNCIGLVEVCESIEACVELVLLDLSYCKKLEKLPRTVGMLKNLKTLLLNGCNLGESKIEIWDIDSPEMVKAKNIGINTKTSSSIFLEAIPRALKFFEISLPESLVSLSLAGNNLSNESFPMDFSCLSMLKELYLDDNPIVSLPNCVRSLPRLELLSMNYCTKLISVEHPPRTVAYLDIYSVDKPSLQKVVFDREMSPLKLSIEWDLLAPSSFEIEGMIKIQPIASVEKKVLRSLGWTNLNFLDKRQVSTRGRVPFLSQPKSSGQAPILIQPEPSEKSVIQMYYEFGIFSTIYGGEWMPRGIRHIKTGWSMSLTIPLYPNKVRGLNFCCLQERFSYSQLNDRYIYVPQIKISNITKKHMWTYAHYIDKVDVDEECLIFLSHWMFGENEMEGGDKVIISLQGMRLGRLTFGVSFLYDNDYMKRVYATCRRPPPIRFTANMGEVNHNIHRGRMLLSGFEPGTSRMDSHLLTTRQPLMAGHDDGNMEEDALDYCKSRKNVIAAELPVFQTEIEEYISSSRKITMPGLKTNTYHGELLGDNAYYEDGLIQQFTKVAVDSDIALGYYKSWNHIIGGDLSAFQATPGEYILDNKSFSLFKGCFTAFSQRKPKVTP